MSRGQHEDSSRAVAGLMRSAARRSEPLYSTVLRYCRLVRILCLSLCLRLSPSVSACVSLSSSVSFCLCLCLSVSVCLCLWLSVCLSFICLPLYVCLILCYSCIYCCVIIPSHFSFHLYHLIHSEANICIKQPSVFTCTYTAHACGRL